MNELELEQKGQLGKRSEYKQTYDPSLLFPIPRVIKRKEINYEPENVLGFDLWTSYELSWLNLKGKPCVGILLLEYPQTSKNIIESKSLKLYLNSFNMSNLSNADTLKNTIEKDLSNALRCDVKARIFNEENTFRTAKNHFNLIDGLDIKIDHYTYDKNILKKCEIKTPMRIKSNLLRSNCLVTGQPDWGSIYISIDGAYGVTEESFLKYVVSFRNHKEFHEQCIERILMDLKRLTGSKHISVYGRYTRRGGIDINPYRVLGNADKEMERLVALSQNLKFRESRQ